MTQNTTISTLSELLTLSGSQFRIYDIGRRVEKISKEIFQKIELNQVPYPFPSQNHAFVAVSFWQKKSAEPYLWFIKLPLDERGLLNQGARNHFIAIIIEALGNDVTVTPSQAQEERLKENPYHFTPAQYKLAFLNSTLKTSLKQPASIYYPDVQHYFSNKKNLNNWEKMGVQGITDLSTRLHEGNNEQQLLSLFAQLPDEVITPLCSALENISLPALLITEVIDKIERLPVASGEIYNHLLRSLSASSQHPFVETFFEALLKQNKLDENALIIIAGRCWESLATSKNMMNYLELVVKADDNDLFTSLFKDLVAIPLLRPIIFECIRSPNRSEQLALCIGNIFK